MGSGLLRLIEPKTQFDSKRKIFSNASLMRMIVPLFFEQLLTMLAYPLSDEIIHLVIVLVLIHNLFNAVAFPASGALPNGLRAAGDVGYTMYVAIISTIVIRFVLSIVLGIWLNLGVIGVAVAMCCDWSVRAVLFLHRFRSGKWKEYQIIEEL